MRPLEHKGPLGPLQAELELWKLLGRPPRYEVRWSWSVPGGRQTASHLEDTAVIAYRVFEEVRRQLAAGEQPAAIAVRTAPASSSPEAVIRRAVEQASGQARERADRLRGGQGS